MVDSPATFQNLAAQSGSIVLLIQLLKKWKLVDFINENSDQLNRFLAGFLSVLTTVGLSYHWNDDVGQFVIGGFQTGVSWYVALAAMTWKIVGTISTTHLFYHVAVKPVTDVKP